MQRQSFRNITFEKRYIIYLLIAAVSLLFMSRNSFLYALNPSEDINCFVTSGNLILSGKIPYRDFFEQKGPVVYWIHTLILALYPNSYHGLYLLEVVCAFFYFVYNDKLLRLFFQNRKPAEIVFINLLSCCAVYFSAAEKGEVEEYLLPLFAYLLYHTVKTILSQDGLSRKTCCLLGLHIGLIFWSKYFSLLLYLFVFLYLLVYLIRGKYFRTLKKILIFCTAGFLTVTIPILLYFYCNHALSQLIDVYFFANAAYGGVSESQGNAGPIALYFAAAGYSLFAWLLDVIVHFSFSDYIWFIIGCKIIDNIKLVLKLPQDKLSELDPAYKQQLNERIAILSFFKIAIWALPVCTIAISLKPYSYYYIPVYSLLPFGAMLIFDITQYQKDTSKKKHKAKQKVLAGSLCLAYIAAAVFPIAVQHTGENIRTHKAAIDMIKKDTNHDLIVYNAMDTGFYPGTGYLPEEYYFTKTNARNGIIAERYDEMIKNQEITYVVYYSLNEPNSDVTEDQDRSSQTDAKAHEFLSSHGYHLVFEKPVFSMFPYKNILIYRKGDAA